MNNFGKYQIVILFLTILLLAACEGKNEVCPQISGTPKPTQNIDDLLMLTPVPEFISDPIPVEINGKMKQVDKLVDYPLCNDHWSGIVYVSCDAKVGASEIDNDNNHLFFKDCQLTIEPNTIVYVAAHNDAPYYKGCSCHTGVEPAQ